eukprot:16267-Heterococcus_DN1.PRE.2
MPYLCGRPLAAARTAPPEHNVHDEAANNHAASKNGPECAIGDLVTSLIASFRESEDETLLQEIAAAHAYTNTAGSGSVRSTTSLYAVELVLRPTLQVLQALVLQEAAGMP